MLLFGSNLVCLRYLSSSLPFGRILRSCNNNVNMLWLSCIPLLQLTMAIGLPGCCMQQALLLTHLGATSWKSSPKTFPLYHASERRPVLPFQKSQPTFSPHQLCYFLRAVRRWGVYWVSSHHFPLCVPVLYCLCCLLLLLTYMCFQRPHLALCCSVLETASCSYYCCQTVMIKLPSCAHSKFIKIKRVMALLYWPTSYKADFVYLICNSPGFRAGAAQLPSSKP